MNLFFIQGENVLLTLKWYEDKNHGNYYAVMGGSGGKFTIAHGSDLSKSKISNKALMGNDWNMNLEEFLAEIKGA